MNKGRLLTGILLQGTMVLYAQVKTVPVFTSGTEGYQSYRIPAVISLPDGQLLAFAEGRVHNSGDFGDINIVMKRSKDHGATWQPLEEVADNDSLQAGNPAPVTDLTDPAYPEGRIFLFYNTGNNHEGEIRKGKGLREVWYKTSVDGGVTWSAPVNITMQVHRPLQPQANALYNFKEDWRSYANTPGHALQFHDGRYRGRIYVAANHSAGNPQPHFKDYFAHGYYTDDHGKTFHLSQTIPMAGNEATAATLASGGLLFNARNQQGNVKARIVAASKNGGISWKKYGYDLQLPDPVCQGSLLNIGRRKGKDILAFCNAADTLQRNNLTLRISKDGGRTWQQSFIIAKSEDHKKDYAAYSDIVKTDDQHIGILFERDGYREIVFATVEYH